MVRRAWAIGILLAGACTASRVAGVDAGAAGDKQDDPGGQGGGGSGGGDQADERTTGQLLERALGYGQALIGTPYGWWLGGAIPQGAPMFASNTAPPDPAEVLGESVNCAGLTNLMMRAAGVQIPQHPDAIAGGTLAYQLMYQEVATPFDPATDYPTGTLIGRGFRDVNDQGHLAVVLDGDMVLQSFAWEMGGSEPGVNSTYTVSQSDDGGFYEYAVRPQDWLGGTSDGCERGDGTYCGGNGVVGDPGMLYRCDGGVALPAEKCASGCEAAPEGEPDACADGM
jgi:hypothetical protein